MLERVRATNVPHLVMTAHTGIDIAQQNLADETKRPRLGLPPDSLDSERMLHPGRLPHTGQAIETTVPCFGNCTNKLIDLT